MCCFFLSIKTRKLRYFGHIIRHGLLNRVILGQLEGQKSRGRPRTTWTVNISERTGLIYSEAVRNAERRIEGLQPSRRGRYTMMIMMCFSPQRLPSPDRSVVVRRCLTETICPARRPSRNGSASSRSACPNASNDGAPSKRKPVDGPATTMTISPSSSNDPTVLHHNKVYHAMRNIHFHFFLSRNQR